jgi:hypothetical protein
MFWSDHTGHACSRDRRCNRGNDINLKLSSELLHADDLNLEIYVSKPSLVLIHCSNDVPPEAKHRKRGGGFRPFVIQGRASAPLAPRKNSWDAALELIDLGLLVAHANYLAFLHASTMVLEASKLD